MVIGLLTLAAIPTTIGVAQGVSQQKRENAKAKEGLKADDEKSLTRKFALECWCEGGGGDGKGKGKGKKRRKRLEEEVHGGRVGLRDGKLWIIPPPPPRPHNPNANSSPSTTSTPTQPPKTAAAQPHPHLHPFQGFYVRYPTDDNHHPPPPLGLVSTISYDPPMLNWIYVDKTTAEVRYGNRTQSREHRVGDWGWVVGDGYDDGDGGGGKDAEEDEEGGLTLNGDERFVVVEPERGGEGGEGGEVGKEELGDGGEGERNEEQDQGWEIRWDTNDDLLKSVASVKGRKVLRISLERRFLDRELK